MLDVRLRRLQLTLAVLVILVAPSGDAHAAEAGDLPELNIEQILELDLDLDAMGITGIHHAHLENEWMFGYRASSMRMRDNRNGTSHRSTSDVLSQFMIAPTDMTMRMHMLDIMYAPSDRVTLMFMLPYLDLSMDHRTAGGARFTTRSSGVGDVKLSLLYSAWRHDGEERTDRIIVETGTSLPTGSIGIKDATPASRTTLPYPMQLGSGTADLLTGIAYLGQTRRWAWGTRLFGTMRFYENREDYQLGNRGEWNVWLSRKQSSWLSNSLRLQAQVWGNIHGADSRLNPAMVPTADPDLRGGRRLDLLVGSNIFFRSGALKGHRIMFEFGVPIYQSLDGPQLETAWRASLNWTFTFRR